MKNAISRLGIVATVMIGCSQNAVVITEMSSDDVNSNVGKFVEVAGVSNQAKEAETIETPKFCAYAYYGGGPFPKTGENIVVQGILGIYEGHSQGSQVKFTIRNATWKPAQGNK